MATKPGEVTQLLNAMQQGDEFAASELLPLVYDELRRLAASKLAHETPGQTLQATALVHEAYLRLVGKDDQQKWQNRAHFFAAAAEAMRRILVDNARRKKRTKHGGDLRQVEHIDIAFSPALNVDEILSLNDALDCLAGESPERAELVKLRFFAKLTIEEAAHVLGISRTTATKHWTFARAWLYRQISDETIT